jgi:predicted PurR-regulated permease PerM
MQESPMYDPTRMIAKPLSAPSAVGLEATVTTPTDAILWSRQDLALAFLAGIAIVCALDWAQAFVISMLLGILFAYTLNPLVAWLQRLYVPRVIGTIMVMTGVVAALGFGAYSLRGQTQTILDQVPEAVSRVSAGLARASLGKVSTMEKVQTAAATIEQAANAATDPAVATRTPSTRVVIDTPAFKLSDFLFAGSTGAAGIIGQIVMVVFLTFFLLLSGDTFRRKLVRLTGPTLSHKKITVHILDGINQSIQRYMLMLLVTNVLIGLLTWIALRLVGMETAGAWAVAAGMLHVIPYLGPAVTAAGIAMTAFVQFDAVPEAVVAGGASLAIATIVGTFVTTWMTGRIASMNTAAVFVLLLFWTWLWGVWGMLLGIPITVIIKVVAEHVKPLQAVAELLGD